MKHKNKIQIELDDAGIEFDVEFFNTTTARKILESIPIISKIKTWGGEIYFDTGIIAPVQEPTIDVAVGDIAYWPTGRSLCIFFGPTPASSGDKPVPASEVVVIGRVSMDPETLRKAKPGSVIRVV